MDSEKLIIRKAEEKDIEQLSEIEMLCFSMPWSQREIAEEMNSETGACFIVAEAAEDLDLAKKGTVLGSVSAWFLPPWEVQVGNFAVRPEARRQGIAGLLMDALIEEAKARGIADISLEVRPSNEAALALYAKYGFKEEGRRKGYYQGKEDALIMWRRAPVKEWQGLDSESRQSQ